MKKLLTLGYILTFTLLFLTLPAKADTGTGVTFSITKTATPTTVSISTPVAFGVDITNLSSTNSAPLTVVDTLPFGWVYNSDAKLTDIAGSQTDFTPTVVGQTLTWIFEGSNLQSIPEGENIVISYTATSPETAGFYTNEACLQEPEMICSSANIDVQGTTTPQAGITENLIIVSISGMMLFGLSYYITKDRRSFEDKALSKI